MAYHPQTDGQTETVNQVLEQYLCVFISFEQDNWLTLLGQALFAYNNSLQSSIGFSPFFANFGYHPHWVEEILSLLATDIPAAQRVVSSILEVHCLCLSNLAKTNEGSARSYDAHRLPTPEFRVGVQVLLKFEELAHASPDEEAGHQICWTLCCAQQDRFSCVPT